jgi:Flp pilus assembly protein TadD
MAEFGLRDLEAAEKDLRHALKLNPGSARALYNLGVLLLEQKRAAEAVYYLERARDTGSDAPELSINLVRAYLAKRIGPWKLLGQPDGASARIQHSL